MAVKTPNEPKKSGINAIEMIKIKMTKINKCIFEQW